MRPIERDELHELAREGPFRLADEELDDYLELTNWVVSVLGNLEQRPPPPDENVAARRDPGRRPAPGEDPLNAVVRWCSVRAEEASGPLAGRTIAVKDSMAVAGVPMTCGSTILADYVPERDSVVAERILRAGGEIVAVTNMDHLAFSGGGDTSSYGPTLCPFDADRTAGGSSSGSGAILWYEGVDAALGTDQGGSIRVPAAWCGVVGLKPTHGLVPYTGIAGIDLTFDHAGPMARTVADAAWLLAAIAGGDPSDPRQRDVPSRDYVGAAERAPQDLGGIRIGVVPEALGDEVGASAPVVEAVRATAERLRALGAHVEDVSLPEHLQAGDIAFSGFVEGMTALLAGGGNGFAWAGRYAPDLARALTRGLEERGDELSPQMKVVLLAGAHVRRSGRGATYATAQNLRPWLRAAYDRALETADALLLPTTPWLPHPVEPGLAMTERVRRGWAVLANTYPTDMTGHPAITLPLAESDGLPVGIMLVARHFADDRLLALGRTLERALGRRPEPPTIDARVARPS